jgi:hypothetical protein
MKFFITEETKQEIEAKIAELEKEYNSTGETSLLRIEIQTEIDTLKSILSSATILPVEESWEDVLHSTKKHKEYDYSGALKIDYPQGVIIQPKQ